MVKSAAKHGIGFTPVKQTRIGYPCVFFMYNYLYMNNLLHKHSSSDSVKS